MIGNENMMWVWLVAQPDSVFDMSAPAFIFAHLQDQQCTSMTVDLFA